jgi:hypothetical protein
MRCKACNVLIDDMSSRTVELEDGRRIQVEEDLCSNCRNNAYSFTEPKWSDYMTDSEWYESMGIDTDGTADNTQTKRRS